MSYNSHNHCAQEVCKIILCALQRQHCKLVNQLYVSVVNKVRKWQCTFQSERMWFVYTALHYEIEWEEVCHGMSVLKKNEQWLNVKFLVKLGKSTGEINEMLYRVQGEDALKPATVLQKGESYPKTSRQSKSKFKCILIVFFDVHSLVHHEYVPEGKTVTAAFYIEALKHLCECI